MPTNEPTTALTGEQLREQLRVGVRMVEALELQITRAQELIQNEDEARRRAEETIAQLESLEARLRTAVDEALDIQHAPSPTDGPGSLPQSQSGNQSLARKLRQLAEQLIETSNQDTTARNTSDEHTIGIAVQRPVELDLGSQKSTSAKSD